MRTPFFLLTIAFASLFSQEEVAQIEESSPAVEETASPPVPLQEKPVAVATLKRWYLEFEPAYFYFTDPDMRQFFHNGGFIFRGELGYRFAGPFIVWVDGSYMTKDGRSIGAPGHAALHVASLTLGLKAIGYATDWLAFYVGAGPRLFMMMLHNDSPYIRSEDNAFGIGGGFDAGMWIFPIPQWPNFFIDLFADYSLKNMEIEEDEISSFDYDVDISGLSGGLGIGFRF